MDAKKAMSRAGKKLESCVTSPYTAGTIAATGVATKMFADNMHDTMPLSLDGGIVPLKALYNGAHHVGEKSLDAIANISEGNYAEAGSDLLMGANVQHELYSRLFNAETLDQITSIAEYTPYFATGLLAYRAGKWGYNKVKELYKNKKERKQHKKLSKEISPPKEAALNGTSKAAIGYGVSAGAATGLIDYVQDKLTPLDYVDSALGVGKTAADVATGGMGTMASQAIDAGRYMINDGIEVSGGLFAANKWGELAGDLTQKAMYFIDKFPSDQLPTLGASAAIIGGLGLAGKYVANKMKKKRTQPKTKKNNKPKSQKKKRK